MALGTGSLGAICVAVGLATTITATLVRAHSVTTDGRGRRAHQASVAAFSLFGLALFFLGMGLVFASPPVTRRALKTG